MRRTKGVLKRVIPVILLTLLVGGQSLAAEADLHVDFIEIKGNAG